MGFNYRGVIPASKSLMNRALICSSYRENMRLEGNSSCDDVVKMKNACRHLHNPNEIFDCGAAGTVLRFLALRLSRIPGRHVLKGTARLMSRPQQDLLDIFKRLGVHYELAPEQMILQSEGWKNLGEPILVQRAVSSQFASGLLLNAWNLEQDLVLQMSGEAISEGYLTMTLEVVRNLGMTIEKQIRDAQTFYVVKAGSAVHASEYRVESDLSSAFAVAAFAALNGQAVFTNFPNPSLQPDSAFVEIMQRMQIPCQLTEDQLTVSMPKKKFTPIGFTGVEANLNSCPDLFPVLATLCAFATTPSKLYGAPQLVHKESDRIGKTSELLTHLQIPHEKRPDGMLIFPKSIERKSIAPFDYDTDHDHRLAFAAALVKSQGIGINILHPEVVAKSFPEFWQVVKL